MSPSVFLIGPGFIGGEVIDHLLEEDYQVTTFLRSQASAKIWNSIGVKTIIGSLDNKSAIQHQVAASDIVIHTATADDLPSVEAVLDGIRQRAAQGLKTIYIHTSGCSVLSDHADGNYKSEMIYNDEDPAKIDALPDSAPHREIDLVIVNARKELASQAEIAIMIPPIIYGVSRREQRLSIQLPTNVRYSIKHGYAGQIGKGLAVWNHVHVRDLACGYLTLLHHLEQASASSTSKIGSPYFFCENGEELTWGECAAEIGRILHEAGRLPEPTPKTIPPQNYGDVFAHYSGAVLGSNARNRATLLRKLGWFPREKNTFASLKEDEIPLILQEEGEFMGYGKAVASGSGGDGRQR